MRLADSMAVYLGSASLLALLAVSLRELVFKRRSFTGMATRSHLAANNRRFARKQSTRAWRRIARGQAVARPPQGVRSNRRGSALRTRTPAPHSDLKRPPVCIAGYRP